MNARRFFALPVLLALAVTFAAAGCNNGKNSQQANSPSRTEPAQPANGQNPPPPPPDQAGNQPQSASANPQSPPPPPATVVVPAGTRVRVRLDDDLGSKISQPGERFQATVADPVVVDGQVVIPRESRAEGVVIDARPLGKFRGGALLELRLERVRTKWGSYPVHTSTMERVEKGKGGRWAKFAGGGGALGAIIGGVAGGGKGALIGGLAGAGAGTAGSAMTGNRQIYLPAETLITFRIEHPVHVTE